MSVKISRKCPKCEDVLNRRQNSNSDCNTCQRAFHLKCLGPSETTMKELLSLGYLIICEDCKHGCAKFLSSLSKLEERVGKVEAKQSTLETRVDALETNKQSEISIIEAVNEVTRRERAKLNVLFHGVPEAKDDEQDAVFFYDMLKRCNIEQG